MQTLDSDDRIGRVKQIRSYIKGFEQEGASVLLGEILSSGLIVAKPD